ncbi:MAG TPA: EfeM/EfeO family lipoprotein [Solirubrobacteraceae bacterium]|nr:EfeM/EfeO family lipoprotein [Solirubrobacteraceae bacterium]
MRSIALTSLIIGAAIMIGGCGGGGDPHGRAAGAGRPEKIALGASSCASGWSITAPGDYAFSVSNQSGQTATASLIEFGSGVVLGRVTDSRPGDVKVVHARLQAGGAYQWTCTPRGQAASQSRVEQLAGPQAIAASAAQAPPAMATVELIGPLSYYRVYVDAHLRTVKAQIATLEGRLAAGDWRGAESAWLAAHLTWLAIGQDDGAYGAFGDLGGQIDGTADGIVAGTSSPQFTGFHRVELDLFRRHDLAAAARDARALARLVGTITPRTVARTYLPATTPIISAWTLRCHEILEDALRDSLSGDDDYGSNSDAASVAADVTATREMLTVLTPPLASRARRLTIAGRRDLAGVDRALGAVREAGRWPGLRGLSQRRRQQINAAVDAALETLAPVSELTQIGTS